MAGIDVHLGLNIKHVFKDGRIIILPWSLFMQIKEMTVRSLSTEVEKGASTPKAFGEISKEVM